jgi:hypothetical protein
MIIDYDDSHHHPSIASKAMHSYQRAKITQDEIKRLPVLSTMLG